MEKLKGFFPNEFEEKPFDLKDFVLPPLSPPPVLRKVPDKIVAISLEIGNTYKYIDNPTKGIDGSLNFHGWTCFVRLSQELEYLSSYIFNSVQFVFETSKEKYGKSVKAESLRE